MNVELWVALGTAVLWLILIALALMFGITATLELIGDGFNSLHKGWGRFFKRQPSCYIEHRIAATELNCYGEIVSESVVDHIKACQKYVLLKDKEGWYVTLNSHMNNLIR